ncbi:MAG: arginine N-succinyltransferase [Alphaproteobacteria bacterium]|nr:arginine N-succinyltransferase [Alphaproteobacteria bacterium]
MIVRAAHHDDLEALMTLAAKAGKGLTTIPRDKNAMADRIDASVSSFARPTKNLTAETYLMVLEEADSSISGLSAIYTNLGHDQPFYSYRLSRHAAHAPEIGVKAEASVLSLVNDFHGYDEIGTLFLDPARRGGGRGKLLSFSRFMLMAAFPERFSTRVMAEMRGWTDEQGRSPFWEAVGRKFFHMEFSDADVKSGISNRFIADLMPKVPIYTTLLPQEAQDVIGITHEKTRPARALLEKQGFLFREQVDVFDAGPCLEVDLANIPLVRGTRQTTLANLPDEALGAPALVAKTENNTVTVSYSMAAKGDIARALGVTEDAPVLYSGL